jgi:DNA-binding transcriptional MerR regulator
LSHDPATRLNFLPEPEESEFFPRDIGPPAAPGSYRVSVTVDGKTETQMLAVEMDPRIPMEIEAFRAQTRAALEVRDQLSAVNEAINRLQSLHQQIQTVEKLLDTESDGSRPMPVSYTPVVEQARVLDKRVRELQARIYNTDLQGDGRDSIHYLARFQDRLQGLYRRLSFGYANPPNAVLQEEMAELRSQLDRHLAEFNSLLKTDVAAFNKLSLDHGSNTLFAGTPIELKAGAAQVGGGK